jgi:hypothetical protein
LLLSSSMERFAIFFSKLALSTGFPRLVGTNLVTEITQSSNKMSSNPCNVNVLLTAVPPTGVHKHKRTNSTNLRVIQNDYRMWTMSLST